MKTDAANHQKHLYKERSKAVRPGCRQITGPDRLPLAKCFPRVGTPPRRPPGFCARGAMAASRLCRD